ncbi:MAG: 50S ribosomal protein L4 [Myxococcota bacterium]|nr:50S ribosomal protein L4 [Myxococcota bacterium]
MGSVDVIDSGGGKAGSVELDPTVFEAAVKPHLFHAEVRRQLTRRRAGTHSTKNRAAVSGGGSKPYRQKGTGRARQGTTRAPQYQGGGVVFGPVPRDYEHRLNKKTRRAALRAAVSLRLREQDLVVAEAPALDGFKTKAVVEWLSGVGLGGSSTLIVIPEAEAKLVLSARNIPGVDVLPVAGLNVYDVLRHQKLLLTKEAVSAVEARLGDGGPEASA